MPTEWALRESFRLYGQLMAGDISTDQFLAGANAALNQGEPMASSTTRIICDVCGGPYLAGNRAIHQGTTRHTDGLRQTGTPDSPLVQCAVCGGTYRYRSTVGHSQSDEHRASILLGHWATSDEVAGYVRDGGISINRAREIAGVKSNTRPMGYRISDDELDRRFSTHPPTHEQIVAMGSIRDFARRLAAEIRDTSVPSREQSNALSRLEEVVYWANRAIVAPEA